MQKKNSFTRITSGLLALVMVLGMVPMGALEVYATQTELTWHEITASPAQTIYKRIPLSEFGSYVTTSDKAVPVYIGFGDTAFYALNNSGTTLKENTTTTDGVTSTSYSVDSTFSTVAVSVTALSADGYYSLSGIENCSEYYIYSFANSSYGFSNSPSYTGTDLDSDEIFWLGMNIWWSGAIHFQPTTWLSMDKIELTAGNSAGAVKMWAEIDTDGNASISKGTVVTAGVDANGTLCDHYTSGSTEIVDTEYTNMYVYVAEEIPATASYAALQTKSYTVTQGEDSDALLLTIRSENSILVNATASETGATSYPLTTDSIGDYTVSVDSSSLNTSAAGTYALPVALSDGTNTVSLGSISVTVTAPASPYAVTVGEVAALDIDGTATASATVTNNGETVSSGYTLAWSSDDTAVATVDASSGVITAVAPGTATITATVTIDGTTVTGTTQVTVNVPSVSISFANTAASVEVGKTVTLTPTVTVKAGETVLENVNYTLAWESSSTGNATVSDGTVTGVAEGSANITATVETITVGGVTVTLDSKPSAAVAVTVEASKEPTLTLNKTETTLSVQNTDTITAAVTNSEATVTWASDNTGVATVADGVITAVAPGTATVTATLQDVVDSYNNPVTATVTVTVTAPVVLSITPDTLTLGAGSESTLTNSITHNGAALSGHAATITWTSDKPGVATVDANGKITAIAGGTATITATLTDLKDSNGDDILLTDANSYCEDTMNVTVIGITVESVDRVTLQITEEEPNPETTIVLNSTTVPSGLTPVITVDTTDTDSSVAKVSYNEETKTVTVVAKGVGNTSFKAIATYTDENGNAYTGEKTIYIKVQGEEPLTLGSWLEVYEGDKTVVYQRLTADTFASAVGKEVLITFLSGTQTIAVYSSDERTFVYKPVSISDADGDGYYEIVASDNSTLKFWAVNQNSGYNFSGYIDDGGYKRNNLHSNNFALEISDWNSTWWQISAGSADSSILVFLKSTWIWVDNIQYQEYYHILGMTEGTLSLTGSEALSTTAASNHAYLYAPVTNIGVSTKAALYAKNYICDVINYSTEYFDGILSECEVWLDTDGDGEADDTYPLNELPSGYNWELIPPASSSGTGTGSAVDSITTTGTYTVKVTGPTTSGGTQVLGSYTVTIEPPASIELTVETDGTLDDSGNLSLGTGKTANVTASVTVTLADGTVVLADMLTKDITIADNQYYGVITFENGVVTGVSQGSEDLTATLNSLSVNGLDILGLVTTKTTTLKVNVFQINYVNLDTSKLSGYVTLDVKDAPSAEMDLAYVTDPANQALPTGVSVSYECEVSDISGTGVEAVVQDGKLVISGAENKGSAEVTVRLILTENPDNAAWESGTVIEKTIYVTVTHNAAEPYEITVTPSDVLLGVEHTKALHAKVTQGTNTITSPTPTITWTSGNTAIATVNENGTVTGVAIGETTVTATVTYTVNEETKTATFQVPVKVAEETALYEMTVAPEAATMNIGGKLSPNVVVKYEGEVIIPDKLNWSTDSDAVTVENGVITAAKSGSANVTVTYQPKEGIELSKTISLTVTEPTLELGIGKTDDTYYIPVGASMPLVPHVDMADEFGSYEVTWEVVDASGNVITTNVISYTAKTYGGLREEGATGITGIQSIDNAMQTIKGTAVGTVTLRAYLSKVNGVTVNGTPDTVTVTVVAKESTESVTSASFYNRNERLYTPTDGTSNPYEFRIIDEHTFQPDSNGMDARIIAQAGDTRVDFSEVKVAVYKNGQLLLDDQGNPFIIPTSELSFYDVSTDQVGWVKVRVTYKDYYAGKITLFDKGAATTVNGFMYDEYTTGEGNTDGYVWMYVCPKETHKLSATAYVNETPVTVTMTIKELRHWLGEGWGYAAENWADATPFYREGESSDVKFDGDRLPQIRISYTYEGKEYVYTNYSEEGQDGDIWGSCPVKWSSLTTGAVTGADSGRGTDRFTAEKDVATNDVEAYGEITFTLNGIQLPGTYETISFESGGTFVMPVAVWNNTIYEATPITFGYTPSWGGQATAYKSFLGGISITSYAISYVADLEEEHFQIGILDVPTQMVGGSWHEWFSLDVPLGTTAVETTFHTVTRSDGVVFIFNPEEDVAEVNYTIDLDPQMLVLKAPNADIEGYSETGIVQATVRDSEGNLIPETAKVTVKWTMRNADIANASTVTGTTGMNQFSDGNFTGPYSQEVTVTSKAKGVTYLTVQLMKIEFADGTEVDASGQGIADYAIIYVIDAASEKNMSVVVDYGKPIDISLLPLINEEDADYNFIGFSDLQHSLRKTAITTYGGISIEETDATYIQSQFMDGLDEIYVIFQYVDPAGKYYWHHHLLNIIPASVMYYETDGTVASEFTLVGDWDSKETENSTTEGYDPAVQDDYEQDSPTHDEVYGYDSSYDYDAYLSNQSSLFVNGMSTASGVVADDPETSASFTFTGTGFDIIARTNMDQATLRVHVYNSSGTKIKTVSVICKGTNALYQIPVIAVRDLEHGTYDVEIIVYGSYTAPEGYDFLTRGNEFYFDAIRIYDPVKGNTIAEAAYAVDGEYDKTITQIGKLLVDQQTFQNTAVSGTEGEGAVFMDSYTLTEGDKIEGTNTDGYYTTTDVGTYQEVGPNNEVYLGKGQGIAFILRSADAVPASIQVGAKSITGDAVTLNAKLISKSDSDSSVSIDPKTIHTSSAMYYVLASKDKIKELFEDNGEVYVVIWNSADAVLSVTDIKVSYGEEKIGTVEYLYSDDLAEEASVAISGGDYQLVKKADGWYYCDENENTVTDYTGLAATENAGTWYVVNGKVDFSYNGLYSDGTNTYYIRGGCVDDTLNGIAERDGQWLYFTNGWVDTGFTGIASYGNTGEWYVLNGEVQVSNSETITLNGVTYNLENGKVISNS